ncbi:hypothetical protein OX90_02410 [Pseudomonas coronafaciens pv. porri]|uniref:Uncharacterized protein n=1 Tax=Pseudomonas coronafaciens pv. porri TaxID=83964 RepID=A0ABR5JUT0_9PSED|nr:hypothetical protein OA77_13610 [Pseudomonas coronafaciens]KOP58431.1 hypothetical protein OX88_01740 [Pseudomonas coronafaciens pv. porri]KOP61150.1 hypothetical protein OX90_02410 [Pseudomonas coronafaciens pv. porri]
MIVCRLQPVHDSALLQALCQSLYQIFMHNWPIKICVRGQICARALKVPQSTVFAGIEKDGEKKSGA